MREKLVLPAKYQLGFENWDAQHSVIISLLQEVVTIKNEKPEVYRRRYTEICNELFKYTQSHFKYEEQKMDEMNYQGATLHRKQHLYFIENVKEMAEKDGNITHEELTELATFLKTWFLSHIQKLDRKFSEALQEYQYNLEVESDLKVITKKFSA